MFKNDYILDMVETLGRSFGKLIFETNDDPEPIVIENLTDKDMIYIVLRKLILDKNYNDAENFLFKIAESKEIDEIREIGQWFYNELSFKSEKELIENNFNRSEIEQGFNDFMVLVNN